jgi:mannose-6-phosphate isomerase
MNRLYPLKFKPQVKEKIWGGTRLRTILNKNCKGDRAGESWEISGFPGNISKVSNGFLSGNRLDELIEVYMGDLVGDSVFQNFGTLFPLLIKFIDANDNLSVQVHPNDELALKQFSSYGKTEMWYVVEADPGAEIIVGFNQDFNQEKLQDAIARNNLSLALNIEKARAGDVFFLPSGRVHAIGKGILLAEIQQTSDATLRIYDYDRLDDKGNPRELHIDKALEAIDFSAVEDFRTSYNNAPNRANQLASCKYFTTNFIHLTQPLQRDYEPIDSFVIYICLEGKFNIQTSYIDQEKVSKGETVLLPAEIKNVQLIPLNEAKILEVYIEEPGKQIVINNLLDRLL